MTEQQLQQQLAATKTAAFDKIMSLENQLDGMIQERNQMGQLLQSIQAQLGIESDNIDVNAIGQKLGALTEAKAEKPKRRPAKKAK